ncbi:MAG TPA: DUF1249 domain-containing protein [Gammaproteobacteria bacterium]|nr:DUF1249 domain-containing protein [Gammaproteobacteria bacterium]
MTTAMTDSAIAPQSFVRPRSFAALMTLYESNFIRFHHLVANLDALEGESISRVPGDCDLHLEVEERTRYTTTLNLTYYFETSGGQQADPDLRIRIYGDARLAEAMACTRRHHHAALARFDAQQGRELSRRWRRNMLLNKWLEYCLDRNHRFSNRRPVISAHGELRKALR